MQQSDKERLLRYIEDVSGMPGLFFEAARTERKLPGVIKKRYRVVWPEYKNDPGLAYGYNRSEVSLGAATADEIWRYDRALVLSLHHPYSSLVWACAHSSVKRERGVAWTKIARILGMSAPTLKKRFEEAMLDMFFELKRPQMAADEREGGKV